MITVDFDYKEGKIISFTMNGHANFAKHGSDLVCAGASAVAFGAVNSIYSLTDIKPDIDAGKEGGYLRCRIPESDSAESLDKVQLLLEAMRVSLQTIEQDYGKYIKINLNK